MKLLLWSTFVLATTAVVHMSKKSSLEHCEDILTCISRSRAVFKSCLTEHHSAKLARSVSCERHDTRLMFRNIMRLRTKQDEDFRQCLAGLTRHFLHQNVTCTGDLMQYHYRTGAEPRRRPTLESTFRFCYSKARTILYACMPLLDCCHDGRRCALLHESTSRRKQVLFAEYQLTYINQKCYGG